MPIQRKSGGQNCQQGSGGDQYNDTIERLAGIRKAAVIDVRSCDTKKVLRRFKEMGNYIGAKMDKVRSHVQWSMWGKPIQPFKDDLPNDPRGSSSPTWRARYMSEKFLSVHRILLISPIRVL